jgi:hypothetical protein
MSDVSLSALVATIGALLPVGGVIFAVLRVTLLSVVDGKIGAAIAALADRTMSREVLIEKFSRLTDQHHLLVAQIERLNTAQLDRLAKLERGFSPKAFDQMQATALKMAEALERIKRADE